MSPRSCALRFPYVKLSFFFFLLKCVCPMLASSLYILKDDAVQQLSVLLLITESSRASQRFRAWSSTGLSGGGVVGGGARGQQRFRVGMVSACSQRLLP